MLNNKKEVLLLIARLLIGGIFVAYGWAKVSDMEATVGFFGQMGLPAVLAYIIAYAEVLGGLALIFGLWLEWAAIGLGIIMIGAVYYVWPMGVQGFGFPLSLLAGLSALLASGSGRYSLLRKKDAAA